MNVRMQLRSQLRAPTIYARRPASFFIVLIMDELAPVVRKWCTARDRGSLVVVDVDIEVKVTRCVCGAVTRPVVCLSAVGRGRWAVEPAVAERHLHRARVQEVSQLALRALDARLQPHDDACLPHHGLARRAYSLSPGGRHQLQSAPNIPPSVSSPSADIVCTID